MQYTKCPITFQQQIERLKSRGLEFNNEEKAIQHLSNISYYRLRAYTYPFQDNSSQNHLFSESISFEQIIELYQFDRQLSQLIFNAIEKIEISLRTQIIYQWTLVYGSHWQTNVSLYRDIIKYRDLYCLL